jgi:hypothetical protein
MREVRVVMEWGCVVEVMATQIHPKGERAWNDAPTHTNQCSGVRSVVTESHSCQFPLAIGFDRVMST